MSRYVDEKGFPIDDDCEEEKTPPDNEIIKALECCVQYTTTDVRTYKGMPLEVFSQAVLDLINRQKAEVERLENGLAISRKETKRYIAFKGGRGFGKQFFFSELVKQAKAEAIKEFAERLKDMHKHNKTSAVSLVTVFDNINDLVKEMVGGGDE